MQRISVVLSVVLSVRARTGIVLNGHGALVFFNSENAQFQSVWRSLEAGQTDLIFGHSCLPQAGC